MCENILVYYSPSGDVLPQPREVKGTVMNTEEEITTRSFAALDTAHAWAEAQDIADLILPVPFRVKWVISRVWTNDFEEDALVDPDLLSALDQIKDNPKLVNPLYVAASELYPDKVKELQGMPRRHIALIALGRQLFSVLLTVVYLHRRLRYLSQGPSWERLEKEMVVNLELGYIIGRSLPTLGPAIGTLLGAVRYLGYGAMRLKNVETYDSYRKDHALDADVFREFEIWNCEHTQVAGSLITSCGMPLKLFHMVNALRKNLNTPLPQIFAILRSGLIWFDAIKAGKRPREGSIARELLWPGAEELAEIQFHVDRLLSGQVHFVWLLYPYGTSEEEEVTPPLE